MAGHAPASSSAAQGFGIEEDDEFIYGAESGWVEARTSCDHLASLSSDLLHIPTPDTACNRCKHPDGNWLCLCCKEVLCSRYVNKHMLRHYQRTNHSLALGFSNLSVWCYACVAYLDAEAIPQLRPVHETAYKLKFGEPPRFRTVEIQTSGGTVSGRVEMRASCDHLASLSSDLLRIPTPDTACNRCKHPDGNWLCLCCKEVLCGRYVNKHMLHHYQRTNHSLVLGFSNLSVWCYACVAYLDAEAIPQLRPVHETAYKLKFGEPPRFRTVEIQTSGGNP